jgi:hypothetical protein
MNPSGGQTRSLGAASLVGIGVGLGALGLYVVAGFLVANWSLDDFLAHLSVGVLEALILAGSAAVACFAVPVAAYLRFRVVSPLAVLAVIIVGWVGYGATTGVLTSQTVFGLAVYAVYLVPLYLLLFAVAGGAEYYAHR